MSDNAVNGSQTEVVSSRVLFPYAMDSFYACFERSPDIVLFKDGEGRWLAANQTALKIFDLVDKPYQNKTDAELAELLHPLYREMLLNSRASDEIAWHRVTPVREEQVISVPEGGSLAFDVVKLPIFSKDGGRHGMLIIWHDVTTYKQVHSCDIYSHSAILDALISSDWLLHSSESWQKVIPDILGLLGAASAYSRVSLFCVESNSQGKGRARNIMRWQAPGSAIFPPDMQAIDYESKQSKRWCDALRQGQPIFGVQSDFPAEEQALLKEIGAQTIILIPVFAGDDWWGMLCVERCDHVIEVASQELGALMAAGRSIGVAIHREASGSRLRQAMIAFESAAEGIVITDADSRIIAVNKGYAEITGFDEKEILGNVPNELNPNGMNGAEYANIQASLQQEGRWRGEIEGVRKNGEYYPEVVTITCARDHLGRILNYVCVVADISESKQAQQKLNEMVNRDALTGLPNRRLLNELAGHALRRAEREKGNLAILFIDLDRFKVVNDTLGHQIGDKLLMEVSNRLGSIMRESDTVARLGGDEFIVMMDSLRDVEDASRVAKKIVSSLQSEFLIDGKEIYIGASVGISIYPMDGQDVNNLIKAADIAMYQVKSSGKNSYRFYSAEMSASAVERFNMELQLRRAVERNQFYMVYQPQISLDTNQIIGAEALVRWKHPELGMVSPAKFIPLAEETGLVIQIGEWVLREAARQVAEWDSRRLGLKSVSVNVSGVQVQRGNFPDIVYGILVETGCDPSLLELEITESIVMNNTENVIGVFNRIKRTGVKLAIDDFGTGYSSLSYLKRLPLDKLKIDQSFVREINFDADDRAIASAVIALARSLELKVIAEGVETVEQRDMLKQMGCDDGQGYLFGRPVSAEEFESMLRNAIQVS